MNQRRLLASFIFFWHGVLASPTESPDTLTASQAEPLPSSSTSSTLSVPTSLSTAVEEAHKQFDGKALCFQGKNTPSLDPNIFERWTRDFCHQTHEPLSAEISVYSSAYAQGTIAYDFHLHWDSFAKNCSGHRNIDYDTCYTTLVDIEKKCRAENRGGTMAKDCIVYTFGAS